MGIYILQPNMHRAREMQSLEIHRRVAERLQLDAHPVLAKALDNLHRWKNRRGPTASDGDLQVWEDMIRTKNLSELLATLVSESEKASRLRQSSPFAGVLDAREVWEIKRRHETT